MSDPRRLCSLAEAAGIAGVSVMTIRRRIADGTLTGYRFGPKLLRIDLDELGRYINGSAVYTGQPDWAGSRQRRRSR